MNEIIELRITGEGVEPSTFNFKKLNEIIDRYFHVLSSICSTNGMTFEYKDAKYSLVEIVKGSVHLRFVDLDENSMQYTSSIALANAILQDNLLSLSFQTQQEVSELGKSLISNDVPLCIELFNEIGVKALVEPDKVILEKRKIHSVETIYGELTDVGGAKPNVHLITKYGSIKAEVTKAQAIELGSRLYSHVGLTGKVERYQGDEKPDRFIVDHIEAYDETKWKENLIRVRELFAERFDGVDVEQFLRNIRSEM